jgi:hypothetical protein
VTIGPATAVPLPSEVRGAVVVGPCLVRHPDGSLYATGIVCRRDDGSTFALWWSKMREPPGFVVQPIAEGETW